jgi:uncharacterized membrane protein YtjA (UPF0391 family)
MKKIKRFNTALQIAQTHRLCGIENAIENNCKHRTRGIQNEECAMLKWAIIFAIISIIAGVLGFTGIAAGAASIAKILFFIFVAIFVIFLVLAIIAGKAVT